MRVWITKYALSKGIFECEAEVCSDINPAMIDARSHGYYHGHDWHRSYDAAVVRAEDMRRAKIKSLEKQLAKLEALDFSVPSEAAE